MTHLPLFEKMIGQWEGHCKTWFEPDKLADESTISSTFSRLLNETFLRHRYQGTIHSRPRRGEELIGFNAVTKLFQVSWIDDFHMSNAIMFSQGKLLEQGFEVCGQYDVGENEPRWGWRTMYQFIEDDHLMITAFNITPEGIEAKALETSYRRISSDSECASS